MNKVLFIFLGCNLGILCLWKEKPNAILQGLHMMWGIGATIAPLMVEPFLSPENSDSLGSNLHKSSRLYIPLFVISALTTFLVIIFLLLCFRKLVDVQTEPTEAKNRFNSKFSSVSFLWVVILFVVCEAAIELMIGNLLVNLFSLILYW